MEDLINPFDAYAEAVKPQWEKTRDRVTVVRARSKAEKRLDEDEILERMYFKERRRRRAELLLGSYGKEIKGLIAFMRTMTLSSAPALVSLIERSTWIQAVSTEEKMQLLFLVDDHIDRLHRSEGLPFPNDAFWDEPPRASKIIKHIITGTW